MSHSIVDVRHIGDALRNTGYKNIESAVAEIIDNAVEADADDIFVIISEELNLSTGRKQVSEIGFLDNGYGMTSQILGSCLGLGSTTRAQRRGMGRFGVGLPQSSLYACPEVEVFSWQSGVDSAHKVFLNIEKVKEGIQKEIEDPIAESLPEKYIKYISYITPGRTYDFSKSGTLVIWKHCDRIQPKTCGPLSERLEFALGQKFRYFISKGISSIRIIPDENQESAIDVCPNDPLFLMENNLVLGNPSHPTELNKRKHGAPYVPVFESYNGKDHQINNGTIEVPVKYYDKTGEVAESIVIVRFSIVRQEFYDETACKSNPGQQPFGKYAKKLEGISVVRANREIDFRQFDFYENINEPEHRWWGCEIIFEPELDELFGVSNNKQYVELKRIDQNDVDLDDDVKPIWYQLYGTVYDTIKSMYARNKAIRKMTRSTNDIETAAVDIINNVEQDSDDEEPSVTKEVRSMTNEQELIEKGKDELKQQGIANPTDEDAQRFINNFVNIKYAQIGQFGPLFDFNFELSCVMLTINTDHKFYTEFLSEIFDSGEVKTSFELLIASFVQAINKTNRYQKEENDRLVTLWQQRLLQYINEQLNPRKR